MAHGSPIYHVCKECRQYILNGRFSSPPICKCGKQAQQITKEDLKTLVQLFILDSLSTSHTQWTSY